MPGRPFDQLSPFGTEPEESNIKHAESCRWSSAAGLWLLAERIMDTHMTLQEAGLTHGDAYLQNFVVCSAPLDVLPIDFDMAVLRDAVSDEDWQQRCAADLEPLLKVAVFLQCASGRPSERAALAELSLSQRLGQPVQDAANPFRRARRAAQLRRVEPAATLPCARALSGRTASLGRWAAASSAVADFALERVRALADFIHQRLDGLGGVGEVGLDASRSRACRAHPRAW